MKISTRGEYGVRAMLELALHVGEGPVPLKLIAERQDISEHYLEQLMGALRKSQLVTSVRGAQGGYELAGEPAAISVGDVIRALEGPIAPVECAEDGKEELCRPVTGCVIRSVWLRLRGAIESVLDTTTLADLKAEAEKLNAAPRAPMYQI